MAQSCDLIMVSTEVRTLPGVGRSVFAAEPIDAGRAVAIFGGQAVPGPAFRELDDVVTSHSIQVHDDVYLVPNNLDSPATNINHSCEPNLRLDGQVLLIAARPIAVGEQLTYDYATSDSSAYDEFECECGTPSCRVKVTGDDWMRPELQARYTGWFSPYLATKIERLGAADRDPSGELVTPPSIR